MEEKEDNDSKNDDSDLWELLEQQYGRQLTEAELRCELDHLSGEPMSDVEFDSTLRNFEVQKALKADIDRSDAETRALDEMEASADKLANEIFEILMCSKADGSGDIASIEDINDLIKKNINIFSLLRFGELVSSNAAMQRTFKGHAKRHEASQFVRVEWAAHREAYCGNKSAFTRHYVKRVLHELGVCVTEKQMREVWLKDPPTASKQAG